MVTAPTCNFLRVNAQMRNLDLAKNGARPQNVISNGDTGQTLGQ